MSEMFALFILLCLSALFSASETAMVSLSLARAESLMREGRRGSAALFKLKSEPQRMLIAVLIGNNVANIAASALATVFATRHLGSVGPGVAVGILTLVVLIFAEITPKSIATRHAERISLLVAPLMAGFLWLVSPLVWVFMQIANIFDRREGLQTHEPQVTESELISMVAYGEEEGTIEQQERQLIERAFTLTDLTVEDVMTPRQKIFMLDGGRTITELLPALTQVRYSRIPLYENDPDDISRVLHLRDLLPVVIRGEEVGSLFNLGRPAKFVPERQAVTETIAAFRQEQQHMAIVIDEHGTLKGLVTFEDLLEELVGEIYDESDELPREITPIDKSRALLDGGAELRVLEEYFGIDLPGKPTDSVSRWLLEKLERIPVAGETFDFDGLQVQVKAASGRQIKQVIVERLLEDSG
ncbi:MAG: hemolysin family protein [Arenicellales bacterium]|nr:hemolysin family protein [Arenicellales bacterium]